MCIWRSDICICNISAVISCLEKACCRQPLRGVIYVLAERYCSRLWINCQTVFSQQIMPFSSKLLWSTLLFICNHSSGMGNQGPRIAELVSLFFGAMFGCVGGVKLIPRPNFSSTSSLAGDLNLSSYSATRVHVEDRKYQTFRYYPQHIAHWLVSSNILK